MCTMALQYLEVVPYLAKEEEEKAIDCMKASLFCCNELFTRGLYSHGAYSCLTRVDLPHSVQIWVDQAKQGELK